MTTGELLGLLDHVRCVKAESSTLEIKAARDGAPSRLFGTLSAFSNQDDGGVILFGIDERNGFSECGVYDAQDLQKRVAEQCDQMEPRVRPLFTITERAGKVFMAAEIPGIDASLRPCNYSGKGRLKGSYIRVGDADEPMTEYEVYSYDVMREQRYDEKRVIACVDESALDGVSVADYLARMKRDKPNLARIEDKRILELVGLTRDGAPTVAALLLFGLYPQAYLPQLCVTAVSVPGTEYGCVNDEGARFIDNRRIEGTLSRMLAETLEFVRRNSRTETVIDKETGRRADRPEYPPIAVREAVLNALIHRDLSTHTEGQPIRLTIFSDRMELTSPGGVFGRVRIEQLGSVQPSTRNPIIATAMELMGETENRYSGIPTIRRVFAEVGAPEPVFEDRRGVFAVTFCKRDRANSTSPEAILRFCAIPRTRQEIADHLGIGSVSYAIKTHVMPLVEQGLIKLSEPDAPRSRKQRYIATGQNDERR